MLLTVAHGIHMRVKFFLGKFRFFSTFLHAVELIQTSSSCAFSRVCIYKTVLKLEFPFANIHFFHLAHCLAVAEFMNGFKILSEFLLSGLKTCELEERNFSSQA